MPTTNFVLTVDTGASAWTNSANAVGADGAYATTTSTLVDLYTDYDGSLIPSGATLGLITVTARGYATWSGGTVDFYLRELGTRNFSDGSALSAALTTTPTTYTLANDTAANLGVTYSNFISAQRLRFRNRSSGGSGTAFIDHITFSVTWEAPPSGNILFLGENF
jgi:hypothetical protein